MTTNKKLHRTYFSDEKCTQLMTSEAIDVDDFGNPFEDFRGQCERYPYPGCYSNLSFKTSWKRGSEGGEEDYVVLDTFLHSCTCEGEPSAVHAKLNTCYPDPGNRASLIPGLWDELPHHRWMIFTLVDKEGEEDGEDMGMESSSGGTDGGVHPTTGQPPAADMDDDLSGRGNKSSPALIVGISVAVAVCLSLIMCAVTCYCIKRRNRRRKEMTTAITEMTQIQTGGKKHTAKLTTDTQKSEDHQVRGNCGSGKQATSDDDDEDDEAADDVTVAARTQAQQEAAYRIDAERYAAVPSQTTFSDL